MERVVRQECFACALAYILSYKKVSYGFGARFLVASSSKWPHRNTRAVRESLFWSPPHRVICSYTASNIWKRREERFSRKTGYSTTMPWRQMFTKPLHPLDHNDPADSYGTSWHKDLGPRLGTASFNPTWQRKLASAKRNLVLKTDTMCWFVTI